MDIQPSSAPSAAGSRSSGTRAAAIVLSVAAGALARRAFQAWQERQASAPLGVRELLADDLLPRARPALLEAVDGLHAATDEAFDRLEQLIRDL